MKFNVRFSKISNCVHLVAWYVITIFDKWEIMFEVFWLEFLAENLDIRILIKIDAIQQWSQYYPNTATAD